ncbi:MAG: hypothetical protein RR314_01515 [Oscillospiraceae bacterium]
MMDGVIKQLGKYKYLLLVLFVGIILILLPGRSAYVAEGEPPSQTATKEEARLEEVLGEIAGVGRVCVLRSEEGVAVVCEGADSAQVRLSVTEAVMRYTGYGSERITVLKMEQEAKN